MKLNKTTIALAGMFLAYVLFFVVSFSTFLQVPVFESNPLMWQAVLEQSLLWLFPMVAAYGVYWSVVRRPVLKELVSERHFGLLYAVIILLTGIGIGVHGAGQIMEEALSEMRTDVTYQLAYFIEEIVGHVLLLPIAFIGVLFSVSEINRGKQDLSRWDTVLVYFFGLVNGLLWGLALVEGGSMYLIALPVTVLVWVWLIRLMRKYRLDWRLYPYWKYFLVSSVVMTGFVLAWVLRFGWLAQPSGVGLQLFGG